GVDDEFGGDALDPCRWAETVRYDGELLDVADGELHLTTTPQDIFGGDTSGLPNIVLQDAPEGDWTVETKMTLPTIDNYQNAGLIAYENDDDYVKFGVVHLSEPGATRDVAVELGAEVGGDTGSLVNDQDGVPDDNTEWWLRLSKTGDTYSGEWSADGETWTDLSSTRDNALEDLKIGVYATGSGSQAEGNAIDVSFDYFRLVTDEGDTTAPTVTADVAGDGTAEVTVTVTADDADGSGVASVEY